MDPVLEPQSVPTESSRFSFLFNKKLGLLLGLVFILGAVFWSLKGFVSPKSASKNTFEIAENIPDDQATTFPITGQPMIVFSQKLGISEKDIENYVSILPRPKGSWHMEKNGQVVYFAADAQSTFTLPHLFTYDTLYTITIDKSLPGTSGKKLQETKTIVFKTVKNPAFDITISNKLISTFPDKEIHIPITTTYYDQIPATQLSATYTVTIYAADEKDLLKYLTYKKTHSPMYKFEVDKRVISQLENVGLKSGPNNTKEISIPAFKDHGIYYIRVKNTYGYDDFFVNVSSHIDQVFLDSEKLFLWSTNPQTGKSVSGIQAQFYSLQDSPTLLAMGVTDNQGLFKNTKKVPDIDIVITRVGQDIAITKTHSFENLSSTHYKVFSYTDRTIYRPGDTVHYKAVIRNREINTYSIPKETMYLSYSQNTKEYTAVTPDANGTIIQDIQAPQSVTDSLTINLSTKKGDDYTSIDSHSVTVGSYRKPDMEITVETTEKEYISRDTAHFTVIAKTLYGQPLTNTGFIYRVLPNNYSEVKDRSLEHPEQSYYGGGYDYGKTLSSGSGVFDEKGKATIEFSTDLTGYEDSQLITLEITPLIGASPSIAKTVKLIHRGTAALFYDNVTADLTSGIQGTVLVLDHANPRQNTSLQGISIALYKVIDYQTKNLLDTHTASPSNTNSIPFSFPKLEKGQYEVVAQGKDERGNIVVSRYGVWVGETYTPIVTNPYKIDVTNDKKKYKVGETAHLSLTANFDLTDFVTILTTSNSSYSYYRSSSFIQSLSQSSPNKNTWTISIPITKEYGQILGVNIAAVYKEKLISSHADVPIDVSEKRIKTSLSFDKKEVKPQDTITAIITTTDTDGNPISADTSLSVIDASILQITSAIDDIYQTFYPTETTGAYVTTYDSITGIDINTGGYGGGCFLEGTQILLPDGTTKPIEQMAIGDTILTRESDVSDTLVQDTVKKTYQHSVSEYISINKTLNVTPNHRIFLNSKWNTADQARLGDRLLDTHGNYVVITSLIRHTGVFKVYNLSITTHHTFFASGLYVHNDKGSIREDFVDTAYWNPHIRTGIDGRAAVSFKVPYNLTTYSALVFSNTQDSRFGQEQSSFISKKDIAIIPTVPNFYYQKDEPILTALVQNGSASDLDATITLSIKELQLSTSIPVHIPKGDYEQAAFPIKISKDISQMSIQFEAKDSKSGKVVDSVLVKKQVLPQGNIESSWSAFEGSKTLSFDSKYKQFDFDSIDIFLRPHLAYSLTDNPLSFDYQPTNRLGEQMFAASYILSKTEDGSINPTAYKYANLRAEFRAAVQKIEEQARTDIPGQVYWWSGYQEDSRFISTEWIYLALLEARKQHMLDEIADIQSLLDGARAYIKSPTGILLENEQLLKNWALGEKFQNPQTPEAWAVNALLGDTGALSHLVNLKIPTADDRYIWQGNSSYSRTLPVYAMVEKGSGSDAQKALRGLMTNDAPYSYYGDSGSPFMILSAVTYMVQNHLSLDQDPIKVYVDNKLVYDSTANKNASKSDTFHIMLNSKNFKSNSVKIAIEANQHTLPVYTTVLETHYKTPDTSPYSVLSLLDFGVTHEKVLNSDLTRTYKDLETQQSVKSIPVGKAGAVVLSARNPFAKYMTPLTNLTLYTVSAFDALSPAGMYLDQTSGNSPQYQGTMQSLFPAPNTSNSSYPEDRFVAPTNYSDQIVQFYAAAKNYDTIILPYLMYTISDGKYYQPKTSLLFPNLGIMIKEK